MKKMIALVMILMLLLAAMTGCAPAADKSPSPAVEKINISYVKLPLNMPSIIEKNNKLFESEFNKDGIEVVFPEITQGSKMTEALAAGSLDFCNALGGTSAILAAANGVDVKIIGIYSRAPKAFTLMTRDEGIQSVADLSGKTVAGPKGTILHQLLLGALSNEDMTAQDVEFVNMEIADGITALSSGNVDAALVAGPAVNQALAGGNRILTTGEGILDATIVIAASGDFIKNHPDLVTRYLQVHEKSLQYMKEHPEDTYQQAAAETGISVEAVKEMAGWYDFSPVITDQDIQELEDTQDFLFDNKMLQEKIIIEDIIAEKL